MLLGKTRDKDNHRGQEITLYKKIIDTKTANIIAVGLTSSPIKTHKISTVLPI